MSNLFKYTKRVLTSVLAAAVVLTAIPSTAFGAELPEEDVILDVQEEEVAEAVVEEEAAATDGTGNEEENVIIEEGEENPDTVAVKRVFTVAKAGGGASGNISGTYGTALTDATYTVTNSVGEVTSYEYKFKKLTGTYTEDDFNNADGLAAKEAMLEDAELPIGLSHSSSGLVVTVSGTPLEVVQNGLLFLVVKDKSPSTTDYDTADDVITKITVNIASYAGVAGTISPARDFDATAHDGNLNKPSDTIKFGSGTKNNTTSTDAKQGYTVGETPEEGKDNIVPVVITYTASTLSEATGGYVNAEVISYDEGDNNTNTSVTSGTESSSAFTVTPAKSAAKLSDGSPAKFTVAPAAGLVAKAVAGTTYKAKLVVTSTVFAKQTYDLEFKVKNNLSVSSVTAHGGTAATGDGTTAGTAYDLGSFKVGETIDDVVIVATGGTGTLSYTVNTSDTGLTTLPDGLSFDTSEAGKLKIKGMANPIATTDLDTARKFAVTVKDSGTGVETAKVFFEYQIAQADVEVRVADGDYVESKSEEWTVGAGLQDFDWFGVTGAAVADEYATVHINNKSGVDLTFKCDFTTANQFTLDPETVAPSKAGLVVKAGKDASFKVIPKTSAAHTSAYTLSAKGMHDTTGDLTYAQNANLTIVKPADAGGNDGSEIAKAIAIDNATIGDAYSYSFKETHPSTISGVTWTVDEYTDAEKSAGGYVTSAQLHDTYGLSFNNGTLSGTVKGAPGTIKFKAKAKANTGAEVSKWVSITLAAPTASVTLSANGKEIAGTMSMGSVDLDKVATAESIVTVANDIAIKQTSVAATITGASLTKLDGSADAGEYKTDFEIVYDDDTARNAAVIAAGGLTLDVGESGEFKIKAKDTITKAGTYALTVKVTSGQMNPAGVTFTANLTVKPVPTLLNTNDNKSTTPGTNKLAYTVGTAADKNNQYYFATLTTADGVYGGTFTYALVDGEIPGLTFNDKGYFEGTPTTAGEYEVTVSATTNTLAQDVTGLLTHKIKVAGNSTLSVKLDGVATTLDNKTYILPGEVVGYAANAGKLALVATAATNDATGVTVSVKDAKDDRANTETFEGDPAIADVIEFPNNPYEGSSNYIGVSTIDATITKNEGKKFYITTKPGAPAGFYKATVTVSGTNASEVTFDVAMVVTDKLAISAPASVTATVADVLTADNTNIYFGAVGGYADQKIVWSEKGTTVDSLTKYYITAAPGSQDSTSTLTKLNLLAEASKIGAKDGIGLKNEVVSAGIEAAGSYTVNLGAAVGALNYTALGTAKEFGHVKDYLDRKVGSLEGTGNDIIPAQTAAATSFPLTIKKSSNPQITDLTYKTKTASSGEIAGTVKGKTIGKNYLSISEYTYDGVPTGYGAQTLTIKMTDVKNSGLKVKPSHTNSDQFTLTTTEQGVTKAGVTWTLTPASGMTKGTYTDTITFKGDDVEDVVLKVTFVVEDKAFLATVDNNITEKEAAADPTLKRSEYIAKSAGGIGTPVTATTTVTLDTPVAAVGTPVDLAIWNTGNTPLTTVSAREVELNASTGKYVVGGNLLTLGNGGSAAADRNNMSVTSGVASIATIPVGQAGVFTVTNRPTTATDKTAFIDVSFKDADDKEHEIVIPVAVLVLSGSVDNINITPGTAGGTVEMNKVAEFYSADDAALTFTVKNDNTSNSGTVVDVDAALSGTDAGKFKIVPIDPDNDDIEAGKSMNIVVKPIEGLIKGTYSATIQFTAANMAAQSRVISFEVEEASNYTADRITTGGMFADRGDVTLTSNYVAITNIGQTAAERLYNSVWFGLTEASDYVSDTDTSVGDTVHAIFLDLDKNGKEDLTLTFTGAAVTTATGPLASITGATIAIHANNSIETASKTIALTPVQQTAAKTNGLGGKKCFGEMTFNLFATVTYGATTFAEKTLDLEAFNGELTVTATDTTASSKTYGQALTGIRTLVPMGSVIGSVFKDSKLPTAIEAGKVVKGWKDGTNAITASTKATKNITASQDVHTITYSTGSTKVEDPGVKWIWTEKDGNYDAVLELTDVSGEYDETSLITITKDSVVPGVPAALDVAKAVEVKDNGSQPATCTKGSRKELKAEAEFFDQTNTKRTFSSTYSLSEAADALGHTWMDPVVTWTDSNADGKYTKEEVKASRTCTVCGEKVDLAIVSVAEAISEQPTCTKDGKATYTVTYTDVDKFGKAAGNVTDTKNVKESVVKALGHEYKLYVEWNDDHKTAKKATLVCSRCKDGEEGHSVDVTAIVTYTIETDKTTGEVMSAQAIYHAGEKDEVKSDVWYSHEHKWSAPVWNWAGPTSATALFTCTVGKETQTIPATVTKIKENAKGDKQMLAQVIGPDGKSYEDRKWYDKNDNPTAGGGIEIVGFEEGQEFKFTGSAIKPPVEVYDNDLAENNKLVLGVDYSLSYKNNTKITTDASKMPTLTVVGKGNYAGKNVTRTFKIVNPIEGETGLTATVKKIELGFTTTPVYNGEDWYPDTITVDGNGFSHSSGDSYTTDGTASYVFTFSNNRDAGTATVGVTGQDGKTKKKTFKIAKVDLSKVPTANLEISPADTEWTVKGAVPATTVTYTPEGGSAITLVEGQDYTLKVNYADKKKGVADGNTVTITGKGANFAKKATSTEKFAITAYTITDDNLLEVVAPAGAKVKAVKTTVVDKNGVKIDKKNYTVNVYDSTDTLLGPTASLAAGSTYKVEVVAPPTGNIDGSASFEFTAAADMSKATVALSKDLKKNGVAYTGEPIDITHIQSGELIRNLFTTGDITVTYKNPTTKQKETLTWDEDFEVVGYQNNVKKGTMTVYIRAKDDSTKVSGVKNFKIKISAKTMKKAD